MGSIGGILGAVGAYNQGVAQNQQAKAQAEQLKAQAEANEARAGIAQVQAEEDAAKRSKQLSRDIGSAYANWAGNGLNVSGGAHLTGADSFGRVLNDVTAEGMQDIGTIKDNGAIDVWGYQTNAAMQRAGARNARIAGRNAWRAGRLGMWSNIVNATGGGMEDASAGIAALALL